ncbi:membrane protein [Kaistella antarctica]|uniref:Membrane protein n=1 Tax=Kaistella antarctica TaxID=266748 RepID=A0A448NP63_9FLAO|nr:membrane protein [Kaistella antarctica]KEY19548.1 membrane protein [Kaistella antarctica]SEW08231.1 hypothetical protein SAMN05421765_2295 [Kaistella antarctica]VEH97163.1 Uncharacterised protein [Kaistella antarctica]
MKRIFVLPLIAAGFFLNAQTIGNSPYAAFGIGDVKYDNTTDISAMGGISTAYIWDFNNNFNFSNPAANKNLELTTLKIEGSNENNFFKSNNDNLSVTKHSSYLSNVTIAFPISNKVKFGLGYQPYSSKKYTVLTSEVLATGTKQASLYRGEGSLSTVQAALSYQITPEFAFGLRSNFFFGNLYDINEVTFSGAELINGYETKNKVKTFNFTLGSAYQKKLENDKKFTLGATYTFGNTGQMETRYINSTYYYSAGETKNNESIIEEKYSEDKNLIPMEFSLGAGYGKDAKWFVGTQVDYKKGETIQFLGKPFVNDNSYKIAAGGWYLPNYNNFRNYFSRVTYRYGAYYEKGNLAFNGTNINQFAITGGMTLPFENKSASRMSGIDLGLELGKRGTLDNNLVRQNFINLKIGINFADKWFNKRLYD